MIKILLIAASGFFLLPLYQIVLISLTFGLLFGGRVTTIHDSISPPTAHLTVKISISQSGLKYVTSVFSSARGNSIHQRKENTT